ncbi:hypothetical protein N0V90_008289 [Kalmusia sp. IMI 367209]|nr:hypothetical protein N0V90_008289 [Kalmusia sp. IMI 367209]
MLQLEGVNLDDPITRYFPELRDTNKQPREQNDIWAVNWDDITIGGLASHLGDIGVDCTIGFRDRGPHWHVLLRLHSADEMDPIGMNNTSATKPDDSLGHPSRRFLVECYFRIRSTVSITSPELVDDLTLFYETYTVNSGGQYYSTTSILLAFSSSILSNSLLTPLQTRKWLKPVTFTSSEDTLIGIFRVSNVSSDQRLIELYTKFGDIITYHTALALIPDYDLIITIPTAGPEANAQVTTKMLSDIATTVLPAVEEAGKEESRGIYPGTYTDSATNSSLSLTLSKNDTAPGLETTSWIVRGVNVLRTYASFNLPPIFPTSDVLVRFRLYPTNLASKDRKQQS